MIQLIRSNTFHLLWNKYNPQYSAQIICGGFKTNFLVLAILKINALAHTFPDNHNRMHSQCTAKTELMLFN